MVFSAYCLLICDAYCSAFITDRKRSCRKIMFLRLSVILFRRGGHVWQRRGWGHAWWREVCVAKEGMHGKGGHVWQRGCVCGERVMHGRGVVCAWWRGWGHVWWGEGSWMVKGGMHGERECAWQGGLAWWRGHAWHGGVHSTGGGHVWRGHACRRDSHWSGQYASYWNAFLFTLY